MSSTIEGLIPGWAQLPPTRVTLRTTSASGPAQAREVDAIPLTDALRRPVTSRLIVRSEDGLSLALGPRDLPGAYLLAQGESCQLVFPGDSTRRRFLKRIRALIIE
ncbi:MAG: hypothetical protein ACI4PG_09285 [Candidatus Ventricola sp.]